MRKPALELLRYTAASAAALLVDAGVLTALVSCAGWQYMPAAVTSYITGGMFLYIVSVNLVFEFRRVGNRALELPMFLALGLVGLVVNTAVMLVAVETLHLHYLIAKAAAAGCTFTTNFLLRRNLMFARLMEPQ